MNINSAELRTPPRPAPVNRIPPQVWTPDKVYPFNRLLTGGIGVEWTPTAKGKFLNRVVVYQIKNVHNSKRYVGQTGDFCKRMASHSCAANRNEGAPLSRALRAHPNDFVVGAIETKDPDMFETSLIKLKNTIAHGYNRRNGGGGGKARQRVIMDPKVLKKALQTFTTSYESPMKYPLTKSKSRLEQTLPKKVREEKDVVYCIQRRSPTGKVFRYIGCTERKVVHRLQEHLSGANHYRSMRNRHNRLYKKMHRFPEQCFVSIIKFQGELAKLPVHIREQIAIQFYKNQKGCTLFNENCGGGGGSKKS